MSLVDVVCRKYDGSLHRRFSMDLLGEDQHGVWLGRRAGTMTLFDAERTVQAHPAGVFLVPRDAWWTAFFWPDVYAPLYCDVVTTPVWVGDMVTMVDLDLDVVRHSDGSVVLDDEGEFAEHQVRYGYPSEVVTAAKDAADHLLRAVRSGEGPFGGAHERWLSQVA